MDTCLRLLHPFTPFVTEELWGHLKRACQQKSTHFSPKFGWEEALIVACWPETLSDEGWEAQKVADFSLVMDLVRSIRNLRTEKKIPPSKKLGATILAGDRLELIRTQEKSISALASIDPQEFYIERSMDEKPQNQVSLVVSGIEIYLPAAELVDEEAERDRMQKELAEAEAQISRLESLLASPFAQKAPEAVVKKEQEKLAVFRDTAAKLKAQLGG